VPLMPVWRNFFLRSGVRTGFSPLRRLDSAFMRKTTKKELLDMGIDLRDLDQSRTHQFLNHKIGHQCPLPGIAPSSTKDTAGDNGVPW
jgi:hypothetical protein